MRAKAFFCMALLTAMIFAAGGGLQGRLVSRAEPQTVTVSERTENRGIDNLVLDIRLPWVSGFGDVAFEKTLNHHILVQAAKAREDALRQAETDKDFVFVLRIDYDVKCANGLFSMRVTDDLDNGGTGFPHTVYYNADIKNSKMLRLNDLFESDAYRKAISAFIRDKIDKDEHFFADEFSGVSDKTAFYVKEGQLYIAFAKYEIASGMTGEPSFAIPTQMINDWLKPEYAPFFQMRENQNGGQSLRG